MSDGCCGLSSLVILQVAPISSQRKLTGPYHSVTGLVEGLRKIGINIALLTTYCSQYNEPQEFSVFHYKKLNLLIPLLHKTPPPFNRPDLVVFHSTYIPRQALLALQCALHDIPYVIVPRGGMTRGAQAQKGWKKRLGNWLFFSRMVRGAAAIHCLTEREAADVRAWGRPVFTVGNGVDLPPADHLAQPGRGVGLQFVFVGRLDLYHKGLDLLVNACSLVRDELRKAEAQVHLYGPDVRNSKTTIEQMVIANDLQGLVQIHGSVYGAEKERVFRSADIFLHTSRFEGHPMAVLEALSYGVPCLLTPGTNMATEVAVCGAGWKVEPHPEAIADGMCLALAGRSELGARGRAGRDLVETKYSWDQVGLQLLTKYSEVLRNAHCNC